MNMTLDLELKLQAWVDGELSAPDARRLEQELAADASATQLAAELRMVKNAMAGNELSLTVPETREFYFSKIQRQIEREGRASGASASVRVPAWRHWLSPALGLAGLACMMILAIKPVAPPTFDEISATGEGMEAVTFHDQSAAMTVVWLADSEQSQQALEAPVAPALGEKGDSEVEME